MAKDKEKVLDNVAAIGEIASGVKENPKEREILREYADGKISGDEADRRLIELAKEGS